MAAKAADDDDAIWVPVTLHLPLGVTKSFGLDNCAVCSLLVGPFSIIMLAQTANTVLVPVLPFLVKDVGASAVSYGMLQSTMWTSQTILAPILGWFSDRYGQKPVILLSLLFSAAGFALLAVARTISVMMVARTISGLGFQVALFRAYFADTAPKKERTGRFGLIGVITSFSLFAGPSIGGLVARVAGRASAAWLSTLLCLVAAAVCLAWQPDEEAAKRSRLQRSQSYEMSGAELAQHKETHKTVAGVQLVKIDLNDGGPASDHQRTGACCSCPKLRKACKFARWLANYDLYPLLSLNFFFRFAFAAYKSVFAFFCIAALGYGASEVGYLLSAMGLGGMFVQGVLVRVVVRWLGEERTLFVAMASTAGGFALLAATHNLQLLVPALSLIAVGYGLTVPCLTTLFSHVPVEQGVMQGIAGAIDRFGQAFGPLVGGALMGMLGEAALMWWTAVALALVSSVCLVFVGEGCLHWMRELCCCYSSDGYRQVGRSELDAIEEEDEDEGGDDELDGGANGSAGPPLRTAVVPVAARAPV